MLTSKNVERIDVRKINGKNTIEMYRNRNPKPKKKNPAKIKIQQRPNRTCKMEDIGNTSQDKVLNQAMAWTLDVSGFRGRYRTRGQCDLCWSGGEMSHVPLKCL